MGSELSADNSRLSISAMSHVTNFDKKQLIQIQKEFYDASSNTEGCITRAILCDSLKSANIKASDSEILDKFFTLFDKTGDGLVNYKEFITGVSVLVKGSVEEKLRLSFELYDFHNVGKISQPEMIELLIWLSETPEYCGDYFPTKNALEMLVQEAFDEVEGGGEETVEHLDIDQFYSSISNNRIFKDFLQQAQDSKYLDSDVEPTN